MSLRAGRGRRSVGRPRATHLSPWRKAVVHASAVTTLLTGLTLLGYSGYSGWYLLATGRFGPGFGFYEWLILFVSVSVAVLGVGLLVGGLDQLLLRNDHKLSVVMLGALLIPLAGGLGGSAGLLTPAGIAGGLLIVAVPLCGAATWILHTAHRAPAAAPDPPDPPQSEPID